MKRRSVQQIGVLDPWLGGGGRWESDSWIPTISSSSLHMRRYYSVTLPGHH